MKTLEEAHLDLCELVLKLTKKWDEHSDKLEKKIEEIEERHEQLKDDMQIEHGYLNL
jgi:hypothetical protein